MSGRSGGLRNCHMCLSEGRLPNKCHFPSGSRAVAVSDYITETMMLYFKRERERNKREVNKKGVS